MAHPNRRFEIAQRRRELRERAIAHLGGGCSICGYDRCSAAMDFHHLDPMEKDFSISERMTSFEAILPELAKCSLLCSRCHREVHDGWHTGYLAGEDRGGGDDYDLEEIPED